MPCRGSQCPRRLVPERRRKGLLGSRQSIQLANGHTDSDPLQEIQNVTGVHCVNKLNSEYPGVCLKACCVCFVVLCYLLKVNSCQCTAAAAAAIATTRTAATAIAEQTTKLDKKERCTYYTNLPQLSEPQPVANSPPASGGPLPPHCPRWRKWQAVSQEQYICDNTIRSKTVLLCSLCSDGDVDSSKTRATLGQQFQDNDMPPAENGKRCKVQSRPSIGE